jgi:hypothetical protein
VVGDIIIAHLTIGKFVAICNILADGKTHSQNEGRGIQNISGRQQSQDQHNKYYMRYLSSLSKKQQHLQQGLGSTPLATGSRQGDTVHSKTAFERWKLNQQDRLEKQKLIEEVVSLSSSGYAKELKETLENLRRDVKEALSSEIISSNNRAPLTAEVTQPKEAELTQDLLQQLVRGQSEIREHLIHLRALCSQQRAEVVALKVQVSTLGEQQAKTIGSTLPTELARLVETTVRQSLCGLEARVSELSGQLKTHVTTTQSRSTAAAVREEDRGMGDSPQARNQQCHHRSTTTSAACVPTLHTAPVAKSSENSGTGQPNSQIQRKRKGPRDYNQQPSSTKNNSSRSRGGELLSQNSTESNSTPCDIDLTQHSPLECSQVISDSIQRLKQTSASSQPASQERKVPKTRPGLPSSPSQAPAAKRKRQTGRVTKQRATAQKGKVLATPKVTRRSQRLSNISTAPSTGKPPQPRHTIKECGAKIKTEEEKSTGVLGASGGGDVLDDWLDFRPPHEARSSASSDVKPVSRFQRSSEAVRRRQVVTQQMSSALVSSDSVLRELFGSAPSILSP